MSSAGRGDGENTDLPSLRPKESKILTLKDLLRVEIHGRIHEINVVHFSPELKINK